MNWWSGQCPCPRSAHGTGPQDISEKSEPQNIIEQTAAAQTTKAGERLGVLQWHSLWGAVCRKHKSSKCLWFSGMPGKLVQKQQLNRCWTAPELPYTNILWELIRMRLLRAGMIIELSAEQRVRRQEINFCLCQKHPMWKHEGQRDFSGCLDLGSSLDFQTVYTHRKPWQVTSLVSGKKLLKMQTLRRSEEFFPKPFQPSASPSNFLSGALLW